MIFFHAMKKLFYFLLLPCFISCSSANDDQPKGEGMFIFGNKIKALPDSVFTKKNLVYLFVGCQGFTIYPPLSGLGDDTASATLETLPERIGELSELRKLIIHCTSITHLPASFTRLKKLEVLDLAMSPRLDIATEVEIIKQLPKLHTLVIFLTKTKPEDIAQLKKQLPKRIQLVASWEEYDEYDRTLNFLQKNINPKTGEPY